MSIWKRILTALTGRPAGGGKDDPTNNTQYLNVDFLGGKLRLSQDIHGSSVSVTIWPAQPLPEELNNTLKDMLTDKSFRQPGWHYNQVSSLRIRIDPEGYRKKGLPSPSPLSLDIAQEGLANLQARLVEKYELNLEGGLEKNLEKISAKKAEAAQQASTQKR